MTFTWTAVAGQIYQIQSSTNLKTWTDLGTPVTAAGSTASGSDTIKSQPAFYRVLAVP